MRLLAVFYGKSLQCLGFKYSSCALFVWLFVCFITVTER